MGVPLRGWSSSKSKSISSNHWQRWARVVSEVVLLNDGKIHLMESGVLHVLRRLPVDLEPEWLAMEPPLACCRRVA